LGVAVSRLRLHGIFIALVVSILILSVLLGVGKNDRLKSLADRGWSIPGLLLAAGAGIAAAYVAFLIGYLFWESELQPSPPWRNDYVEIQSAVAEICSDYPTPQGLTYRQRSPTLDLLTPLEWRAEYGDDHLARALALEDAMWALEASLEPRVRQELHDGPMEALFGITVSVRGQVDALDEEQWDDFTARAMNTVMYCSEFYRLSREFTQAHYHSLDVRR
jgi:signal transduction histidine kinase